MGKIINIGIIGLGEVAQIIHLPILEALPELYRISALCDISPKLLEAVGDRYSVERLFTDVQELLKLDDLDAVFVLNSDEYHTDAIIGSLNRGMHVFVEKPMCLTLNEAEAIIKARDQSGKQVMVGYMRRFAPAYVQAVEEVRKLKNISYARIRDIIGPNKFFTGQSSRVLRFDDIPAEAMADRRERATAQVKEAIGETSNGMVDIYRFLTSLSSHDLSAMRELMGMPKRVVGACLSPTGLFLNAVFEFDTFCATFETGTDGQGRFDAHLEVYGETKSIKVQYNTPYIRHLPTTLHITETVGESFQELQIRPSYKDAYSYELEYFYDVVIKGVQPKTTPEDFTEDLLLFHMIMEALQTKN
jgi:predicted dehydrogenase